MKKLIPVIIFVSSVFLVGCVFLPVQSPAAEVKDLHNPNEEDTGLETEKVDFSEEKDVDISTSIGEMSMSDTEQIRKYRNWYKKIKNQWKKLQSNVNKLDDKSQSVKAERWKRYVVDFITSIPRQTDIGRTVAFIDSKEEMRFYNQMGSLGNVGEFQGYGPTETADQPDKQKSKTEKLAANPGLEVSNVSLNQEEEVGATKLIGEIKNKTNKLYSRVYFQAVAYNNKGELLNTRVIEVVNIGPGETKAFKAHFFETDKKEIGSYEVKFDFALE